MKANQIRVKRTERMARERFGERSKPTNCDFAIWRKMYIADYKPDLTEVIFDRVINGRLIKLNLLSFFNIADTADSFGDFIRRKLMLQAYTGQSQRDKLQWIIEFNLQHGNEKMRELIFKESLV